MPKSADRDDDEKDDKDAKAAKAPAGKAAAARPPAREEDESEEDEEEDEEEEAKPAKPTAASAGKPAAKRPADDEEDEEEEEEEEKPAPAAKPVVKRLGPGAKGPGAKVARGPGASRPRQAAAQGSGSLGKSVLLFFVIVIGLGAGFAILGREPPTEIARPKWTVGQVVDVEVTLVRSDRQDLACATADEVAGKHCGFEAMNKPWTKGDVNNDKLILKPYTTTDRVQFTAAGLWSDPGMAADKLPAARFSVKCKYKVEGSLKNVQVRWEQTGQWYPNADWYAGSISDCKITP